MSPGTVSNVLKRAEAAGLAGWPLPDGLGDEELRGRLYPRKERSDRHPQPDWDAIVRELEAPPGRRRAKLTQRQLWAEHRDEVQAQGGPAYSHSRFCALLRERLEGRSARTEMRFDCAPGLYGMLCQCQSKIPQLCRSDFPHPVRLVTSQLMRRRGSPFLAVLFGFSGAVAARSAPSPGCVRV